MRLRQGSGAAFAVSRSGSRSPAPVRGVPGGWRDWWDSDDGAARAAARDQATRFDAAVQRVATAWRADIAASAAMAKQWVAVRLDG
jgi:hypothetical protein